MHHNAKNCIDQQKRRVNKELDSIGRQLCTYSSYDALPRSAKLVVEHHRSAAEQEAALQRDLAKADRMASRIAHVAEQLRRDFNGIKDHLGSYTFANTSGPDSGASGDCSGDLTQAIDTREAWKQQLCCLLGLASNYVGQQRLGDYAILHSPPAPPASGQAACCPVGHRDAFTYSAPQGDCLGRKAKAVVSNPDLAIDQLYTMLCTPTEVEGEEWPASASAWYTYLRDIIVGTSSADEAVTALLAAGLPQALVDVMSDTSEPVSNDNGAISATAFVYLWHSGGLLAPPLDYFFFDMSYDPNMEAGHQWADMAALFPTLVPASTTPATTASIETECDASFDFVRQAINSKVDEIRALQLTNDAEQKEVEYMRSASESNRAYHEQAAGEATAIDEGALRQRRQAGEAILADLDRLGSSAHCIKKSNFFK